MYNDELKGLLELNPNIQQIWIDADGNWHTHEIEEVQPTSREDILKPSKKTKANE